MSSEPPLERYKGFLIAGSALPRFATGFDWYAQGMIFRPGRRGSVVQIRRIQGPVFHSKEEAERCGLKLCREWVDGRH